MRLHHWHCNERQRAISDSPALLLSAKADDIVEASSELDGIIVILDGFRWIDNERYLDMNTFERLLMLHTIAHMLSGHDYARALRSHFLTAASLTALVGPTRYIKLDGWDRRSALTICSQFPFVMYLSHLQCYLERRHPKANFAVVLTLLDRTLVHRNYHPNNVGTHLQMSTLRQTGLNEIA